MRNIALSVFSLSLLLLSTPTFAGKKGKKKPAKETTHVIVSPLEQSCIARPCESTNKEYDSIKEAATDSKQPIIQVIAEKSSGYHWKNYIIRAMKNKLLKGADMAWLIDNSTNEAVEITKIIFNDIATDKNKKALLKAVILDLSIEVNLAGWVSSWWNSDIHHYNAISYAIYKNNLEFAREIFRVYPEFINTPKFKVIDRKPVLDPKDPNNVNYIDTTLAAWLTEGVEKGHSSKIEIAIDSIKLLGTTSSNIAIEKPAFNLAQALKAKIESKQVQAGDEINQCIACIERRHQKNRQN